MWQGVVIDYWTSTFEPLLVDTTSYSHPLLLEAWITQNGYINQLKSIEISSIEKKCFDYDDIANISRQNNCSEICVPVAYRALFYSSNIKACSSYDTNFCIPISEFIQYVEQQNVLCKRPSEERYYRGITHFKEGIPLLYSSQIEEERKNRTLLIFTMGFDPKSQGTIKELKLVYGFKDLLAWTGGALGIFVGYSLFDFLNHVIDITFHCIDKQQRTL